MFGLAQTAAAHDHHFGHAHQHGHAHHHDHAQVDHSDSESGELNSDFGSEVGAHAHVISILSGTAELRFSRPSVPREAWIADFLIRHRPSRLERPPRTTDI